MTSIPSESLHRHMPEPVSPVGQQWALTYEALRVVFNGGELTFAHVLNVPVSEDIWPGEAVDLFLLPFFAKSPDTGMFVQTGEVYEHMRCEILRLCSAKYSAKEFMEDELAFYYEFDGPFTGEFGDSSDDEGELLLTKPDWLEDDLGTIYLDF